MYYRMTMLHWDESRTEELESRLESIREQLEVIQGLAFAEFARTGAAEGMVIAAYDDDSEHTTAVEVALVSEKLADLLISTPHGHEGGVIASYGDAPSSR